MAYVALLHSNAVLRAEEDALPPPTPGDSSSSLIDDSGQGWGALLAGFRKRTVHSSHDYPRWKWVLDLACAADGGNHWKYFCLLEEGPAVGAGGDVAVGLDAGDDKDNGDEGVDDARFIILARCIASRSLNLIRLGAVRRYNRAFGKAEAVMGVDLARMLCFSDGRRRCNKGDDDGGTVIDSGGEGFTAEKAAVEFCLCVGLPVQEGNDGVSKIVFKSAPISISGTDAIGNVCDPGRTSDSFVFGSDFDNGCGTNNQNAAHVGAESSVRKAEGTVDNGVEDWEDREDDVAANGSAENYVIPGTRIDEDGVVIPPNKVIWNLIQ